MNKTPLFKGHEFPVDAIHIKAVMPYSNLNQDMVKKYYSPSAVSMAILLEANETLKGFYGNQYDVEDCKILFPKDTIDPLLVIFNIPEWEDGKWEERTTYKHSMCIAIAPRARLNEEKVTCAPMLSELENTLQNKDEVMRK